MKRISDEQLAQDLVCLKRTTCVGCRFKGDCYASINLDFNADLQNYVQDLNVSRKTIAKLKAKIKEKK